MIVIKIYSRYNDVLSNGSQFQKMSFLTGFSRKLFHMSSNSVAFLTLSAQCCVLYRNQSFNLHYKSNDWFQYEMQHWVEMG